MSLSHEFTRVKYRVQATLNDDHHIIVEVSQHTIDLYGEQWAVGHAAWCELMANEKDEFGNRTDKMSASAQMLRALCKHIGVDAVKERFINTIVFKPEREED